MSPWTRDLAVRQHSHASINETNLFTDISSRKHRAYSTSTAALRFVNFQRTADKWQSAAQRFVSR